MSQRNIRKNLATPHRTEKLLHCTSFCIGKTLYFFLRENPSKCSN
jgi:hypothetical protein